VTSVFDVNDSFGVDLGADVIVPGCHQRKGDIGVQLGYGLGCPLNPLHLPGDGIAHIHKKFVFQGVELIFCPQDHIFQLLQPWSDITLRVGEGLLSGIVFRHHIFEGIGHLQIIAEYLVVFDLQIADACLFPLFGFQFRQPGFSFCFCLAEMVHIFIITIFDDAALLHGKRRFLHNGGFQKGIQIS